MPKVIDLFSGVGGLSIGFKNSGYDIIYANEFDLEIAESYSANHQNTIVDTTDINEININKIFNDYKNIDVVVGGPPCQGYSQKGQRLGLNDSRNFLFKKFLEIVDFVKPKVFLIENVPNIITTHNGYFLKNIKYYFSKSNYMITSQILNSYFFGVPQKRKRAFIIGFNTGKTFKFPDYLDYVVSVDEAISDLPKLKSGEGINFLEYSKKPNSNFQKIMRKGSKGIYNHISTRHSELALKKLKLIPPFGNKDNLPNELKTKSIYSGTWSRINPNGPAKTITTRFDTPSSGEFTLNDQDRCLTVREAARIQSFQDKIIFFGNKQSQMKQVGNAVPPFLSEAIAKSILKII